MLHPNPLRNHNTTLLQPQINITPESETSRVHQLKKAFPKTYTSYIVVYITISLLYIIPTHNRYTLRYNKNSSQLDVTLWCNMVFHQVDGINVDKVHLYFIQAGNGPILLGLSMLPSSTALSIQKDHYDEIKVYTSRPGDLADLNAARAFLAPHLIRGAWYAPSPEVMAYADGVVPAGLAPKLGGRKLTKEQAIEVFRLAHTTSQTYAAIGNKFGVTPISVGRIARGHVYPALFWRVGVGPDDMTRPDGVAMPPVCKDDFYVSEARPDAPRYRMTPGKRGTK